MGSVATIGRGVQMPDYCRICQKEIADEKTGLALILKLIIDGITLFDIKERRCSDCKRFKNGWFNPL